MTHCLPLSRCPCSQLRLFSDTMVRVSSYELHFTSCIWWYVGVCADSTLIILNKLPIHGIMFCHLLWPPPSSLLPSPLLPSPSSLLLSSLLLSSLLLSSLLPSSLLPSSLLLSSLLSFLLSLQDGPKKGSWSAGWLTLLRRVRLLGYSSPLNWV